LFPSGYKEYPPTIELRTVIDWYWTFYEADRISVISRLPVIPDGCVDLVHVLEGSPGTRIVGPMTQALSNQNTKIFGIRFSPFAPSFFLPIPLVEFIDQSIDLHYLKDLKLILEDFQENLEECMKHLNRYFLFKLQNLEPQRREFQIMLNSVFQSQLGIEEISNKIGLSRQHLSRKCRELTGLSPKFLQRVFRVQKLISNYDQGQNWATTASELGYFDQSHLIREFTSFTTMAPTVFFSHSRFQISNTQAN
jgi:AraC-like DNA-binding protein